ncbi:NADH dehydrogenase [ubiquinone] iron-sulfur protein 4 [Trichinella spiralis]|uniref:NADH dehydrogenase [ubiquinone] iron-sulfur protein 4, mitochondrial n=1 Tax=Trichinella spiralis TaxID=6334 RepID=A0ABR3K4C4_TRISP
MSYSTNGINIFFRRTTGKSIANLCVSGRRFTESKTIAKIVSDKEDAQQKDVTAFVENHTATLPTVETDVSVSSVGLVNGVPEKHIKTRRARIFMPAKAAPQSGTDNIHVWKIEFDTRDRWESRFIGWCSNSDPLSNISMAMEFATSDDAVAFCIKNGWEYDVFQPQKIGMKPKSYAENFSWNKRTRITQK